MGIQNRWWALRSKTYFLYRSRPGSCLRYREDDRCPGRFRTTGLTRRRLLAKILAWDNNGHHSSLSWDYSLEGKECSRSHGTLALCLQKQKESLWSSHQSKESHSLWSIWRHNPQDWVSHKRGVCIGEGWWEWIWWCSILREGSNLWRFWKSYRVEADG